MTTPRADSKADTPPKKPSAPTEYEVSIAVQVTDNALGTTIAWKPVGTIETKGGAPTARRKWADGAGPAYDGEELRAVPVSNINQGAFEVENRRVLIPVTTTHGAP